MKKVIFLIIFVLGFSYLSFAENISPKSDISASYGMSFQKDKADGDTFVDDSPSKSEVSVYYGFASVQQLVDDLSDVFISIGSIELISPDTKSFFGPVGLSYSYWLKENFAVGIEASLINIKKEYTISGTSAKVEISNNYYTFMPNIEYRWYHSGSFNISSGVSIGACYFSQSADKEGIDSDGKLIIGFNVSAFKLKITPGVLPISVYGDLGFGYRGLAALGISVNI